MSKIKLPHASGNSMSIAAPATNPASDLELKLPATIGSANQVVANSSVAGTLAFATLPLNEVDQWVLTADKTSNGDITSDLARASYQAGAGKIGTGMTESSGVFSFPSTGIWLVNVTATFSIENSDNVNITTYTTTNNGSNWHNPIYCHDGNNGTGAKVGMGCSFGLLDVTDTSQVKVKFNVGSIAGGSVVSGGSATNGPINTQFLFVRLGDT